jgi:DNA helicase-2/ATP-dependent DNA helicase PcrA
MWRFDEALSGATRDHARQNYRSTQAILDVAERGARPIIGALPQSRSRRREGTRVPPVLGHLPRRGRSVGARRAATVLALREQGCDLRDQAVLFRAGHHSDALELELVRRDIPFVKYGGLKYLEAAHVKDLLGTVAPHSTIPTTSYAWHRVLSLLDGVGPRNRAPWWSKKLSRGRLGRSTASLR